MTSLFINNESGVIMRLVSFSREGRAVSAVITRHM